MFSLNEYQPSSFGTATALQPNNHGGDTQKNNSTQSMPELTIHYNKSKTSITTKYKNHRRTNTNYS